MPHTRRHFLKATGLTALTACAPRQASSAPARKANIVYIMSDELGYYELSCMGNPHIQTPHIDRLAAEGVRFTQALAGSSVCAPTRCCLMTGKHGGHASVRANDGGTPLRAEEETVASMLKKVGYATGGFGKWGCGGRGSTGVPEKHGFDIFVGYYDQVHAHSYYPPYILKNSEEVPLEGNQGGSDGKTYSHYAIMDEARKFLRENKAKPFFLYLPVTPPHGIFDIPDTDPAWALYKDKPWPEAAKRYAAMVSMLDRNVGEVVAMLKKFGIERNTLVFFCGDNGGADYFRDKDHPRGFHGANKHPKTGVEFRGRKGNLYEGGLRIPMIAWWPGAIAPGRVSDLLWYFPDVMPTVAEVSGAPCPKDTDGISIVPELLGEKAAGRPQEKHPYLYWELGSQKAVRMGHWKAIQPHPRKDWELYDLATDVSEANDVSAKHPDVLAKMKAYAQEAHEDVRPGTFRDRELHERDRRAKYGNKPRPTRGQGKANALPQKGLIPTKDYKLVSASSENRSNAKLARHAFDGDPRTHWHTKFADGLDKYPHELVIDLGAEHTIRGFRYLARQDGGWNGAIKDAEFYVSNDPKAFGKPAAKATFAQVKKAQEVTCPPVRGRYVKLRALSELNGNPWASAAEVGVVGE